MRIAYLLADHGIPVFGEKGASIHVRDFCEALCDQGHETTIFCAKHGNPVREAPYSLEKVIFTRPPSPAGNELDSNAPRRQKETRYAMAAEAMLDQLEAAHKTAPFDAIYERYSLWSAAGVRAAVRLNVPIIIEVNAPLLKEQRTYRELQMDALAETIEAEVFAGASSIIAVSIEVAEYVIEHGASPENVQVLPNGVSTKHFHPAVAPAVIPKTADRFVIGFSGSLKAWHGIEILMDAFRELVRRMAGIHLLIIGDGPVRDWLEGYIHGAGLDNYVTMTGWVEHDEIPALLAATDVTVAPYPQLDDFYFSPIKLFEYLALAKPIVASDIGQIGEVIQNTYNGLLVKPGDSMALADALEQLYIDERMRQQLAENAATTGTQYTWHNNAKVVESLIRQQLLSELPQVTQQ